MVFAIAAMLLVPSAPLAQSEDDELRVLNAIVSRGIVGLTLNVQIGGNLAVQNVQYAIFPDDGQAPNIG